MNSINWLALFGAARVENIEIENIQQTNGGEVCGFAFASYDSR